MPVKKLPSSRSAGKQPVSDSSSACTRPVPDRRNYPGSRSMKTRYHYNDVMPGVIELAPGSASEMTPDVFGQLLRQVEEVDRVILHPKGSKTQKKA